MNGSSMPEMGFTNKQDFEGTNMEKANSTGGGFQPAAVSMSAPKDEDDLDEEEKERISQIEQE